mgnify:CR=1 FL=1
MRWLIVFAANLLLWWLVGLANNYLAAIGTTKGLRVADCSSESSLSVGPLVLEATGGVYDMVGDGSYLYVTAGTERVSPDGTNLRPGLYRVAQEALQNSAQHAQASGVDMRLQSPGAGRLVLRIDDDGIGIPPENRPRFMRWSQAILGLSHAVMGQEAAATALAMYCPGRSGSAGHNSLSSEVSARHAPRPSLDLAQRVMQRWMACWVFMPRPYSSCNPPHGLQRLLRHANRLFPVHQRHHVLTDRP